ncbi:unnamed protein product [Urochloa humidicola]
MWKLLKGCLMKYMWCYGWATKEPKAYAQENGLLFMEAPAKTAINVSAIFNEIGQCCSARFEGRGQGSGCLGPKRSPTRNCGSSSTAASSMVMGGSGSAVPRSELRRRRAMAQAVAARSSHFVKSSSVQIMYPAA